MNFENLKLMEPLLRAVQACGYDEPTPIQREIIPPVLDGRDVLGCAQTGTGKTAAFALPILQRLQLERKQHQDRRTIRALILTPTRELALQIDENFKDYEKFLPLRSCVIFGGVGQQPQVAELKRGVDILVATPGRLNDLIGQGFITLSHIEIFVLDEADRMLDMGFIHDVKRVIALLPQKRQTLLFSATMPAEVEKLTMTILSNPVTVKVDPVSSTVDTIDQTLYLVDKANKKLLLASLLRTPEVENALVFTRTKHGADRVVRELDRAGIKARAIHGDKSQNARQEALAQFKSGQVRVMIATDIAARGIDIAGLSHVFNYDLPHEPEAYVHRIGRTGRAGHEGSAISFCCIDEMADLKLIEKLIGKPIPRKESPWPMEVFTETVKEPRGARPSRQGNPEAERSLRAAGRRGGQAPAGRQADEASPRADSAAKAARPQGAPDGRRAGQSRDAGRRDAAAGQSKPGRTPDALRGAGQKQLMVAAPRREGAGDGKAPQSPGAKPGRTATGGGAGKPTPGREPQPPRRGREPAVPQASSGGSAAPAMRATPLERPTHALPSRAVGGSKPREEAPRETSREAGQPAAPAPSYEQYMKRQRRSRGPLSTGHDRW